MKETSKEHIARLQIILVMVTFGTIGFFVKQIDLPSAEIALYRGMIAFATLLLFIIYKGSWQGLQQWKGKLWKLLISGVAIGFNWIFLFEAYRYTSVALSTLSYYFAPTVVILLSATLLKERLTKKQLVSFIASTAGLVLIIGVSGGGSNDSIGIFYGLAAAMLYANIVVGNKIIGEIDRLVGTCIQFAAAVVVLFPYVAMVGGFHIGTLNGAGWVNLLILGVVHTGIMYYLYFTALAHLRGQQAAILSYIDPVVAVLVSMLLLGEYITALQLLGGGMILLFTLINEVQWKKIWNKKEVNAGVSRETR